jgi:hypothetical protein
MSEPNFTQRASQLANQAADAAGPAIERARVAAGELAEKAGPYVDKAATAAAPYLRQAAELAAQGVSAAAGQLDKATSGKYSDRISTVAGKIGQTLDREKPQA